MIRSCYNRTEGIPHHLRPELHQYTVTMATARWGFQDTVPWNKWILSPWQPKRGMGVHVAKFWLEMAEEEQGVLLDK